MATSKTHRHFKVRRIERGLVDGGGEGGASFARRWGGQEKKEEEG